MTRGLRTLTTLGATPVRGRFGAIAMVLALLAPGPLAGAAQGTRPGAGAEPPRPSAEVPPRGYETITGLRVVALRTEPEAPAFGEPFALLVVIRARANLLAALPDTLFPTPTAESAGRGEWTRAPAPGDSVDFAAAYPVIGFHEGLIEYPWIELDLGGEIRHLRLGGRELAPFTPLDERGLGSPPRPPADVLGGGWSAWRILAVSLFAVAGIAATGFAGRAGWIRRRLWLEGRLVRDPRADALAELDRVFATGWHRNGRVADFYASTGDAVRRLAAARDPEMGTHLTSTELLARLTGGDARRRAAGGTGTPGVGAPATEAPPTEALEGSLLVGERVKFGGFRPHAETAEGHWRSVRDWVRDLPEP